MIVAVQRLDVLPVVVGVPDLEREVRRAGNWGKSKRVSAAASSSQVRELHQLTEEVALAVKVDVLHGFRVALDRPLKVSRLPIPHLQTRILARAD